jgi:uncharacterized protein
LVDVFISYKRGEGQLARRIAEHLQQLGLEVWFDTKIQVGESWDERIDHELRSARAVVVCWTRQAVASPWVLAEAMLGDNNKNLVPVFFESCDPPGPLARRQGANLRHWHGEPDDPAWQSFLRMLEVLTDHPGLVEAEQARAQRERASARPATPTSADIRPDRGPRNRRRILSIDGCGVRAPIVIAYLQRLQTLLAQRADRPDFVLADYFDLIGGTSIGAVIAANLCLGRSAVELGEIVELLARAWRSGWLSREPGFSREVVREYLHEAFGDMSMGASQLRTGLAICTRRQDTDSTWLLTNNPYLKFWAGTGEAVPNRDLMLRSVLEATMATPGSPRPATVEVVAGAPGQFVDATFAGLANPAFELFMSATIRAYGLNWRAGEDRLFLVSCGTLLKRAAGAWRQRDDSNQSMLANSLVLRQTMMCQFLGRTVQGTSINSEVGSLADDGLDQDRLFSYLRYDPVGALGPHNPPPDGLGFASDASFDAWLADLSRNRVRGPGDFALMHAFGRRLAEAQVRDEHFLRKFDLDADD